MKKTVLLLLCLSALTAQAADGYMSLDSCRWMTNTRLVHEGKTPLTQAYDGQGVIVGVIDGGMQYDHPTFRNAQGELRIRKIWDKNEDGTEVELTDPQAILARKYSYCSLYGPMPTNHGAHVTGIAAGSGRYKGMAPASEIIFADVALNMHRDSTVELYQQRLVQMVRAMMAYADSVGKPIVINISMGVNLGFSTEQQAFQEEFKSLTGPGHIVVSAAGNEGNSEESTPYMNSGSHTEAELTVLLPGMPMSRDIYLRSTDTVVLSFSNPDAVNAAYDIQYKRLPDAPDGKKVYKVRLIPKQQMPSDVQTTIKLKGTAPFELFASRTVIQSVSPSDCTLSTAYTVSMPAPFPNVIAVANYALNESGRLEMAPASSWGPSWDGRNKPDVTAIGSVISAGNYYNENNKDEVIESFDAYGVQGMETWVGQYGTSQASPMVAGIIALWLQAKPTLTPEDVLALIRKTSKPLEAVPNTKSGAGLIDAYAGLLEILGLAEALPSVTVETKNMYYDLLGRPVGTKPSAPGIYVTKGKKIRVIN